MSAVIGKPIRRFPSIYSAAHCVRFAPKGKYGFASRQSSETECEALSTATPNFADLMAELESIVGRLECDLREGRAAEPSCAEDLHRLRLSAERLFPED